MPYVCKLCPIVCKSINRFEKHKLIHKKKINSSVCIFCNKQYANTYNLNKHMYKCQLGNDIANTIKIIEKIKHLHDLEITEYKEKNDSLRDKIKELESSLKGKNDNSDDLNNLMITSTSESLEHTNNGNYVYIIKEREFIKTNENIYKIGETKKGHYKRFDQYPKGSVVMALIKVPNSISYENKIKTEFNKAFKRRKDIGHEYYEVDFQRMYKKMVKIVFELNKKYGQ